MRFQSLFTLLSECFSPFPHGTCSLSVIREYLALEDGPPRFPRGCSCPMVLEKLPTEPSRFRVRGCHPLRQTFPGPSATTTVFDSAPRLQPWPAALTTPIQQRLQAYIGSVWACPGSLATTTGVSFDFLSCGYLDVSVPRVGSHKG